MTPTDLRDAVREMGLLLEKHGVTVATDALMTAVYVEADSARNEIITTMGSCAHAEEVLEKYNLHVFAYQQLKRSLESIRDFASNDKADPLVGTYWPCPKR